MLFFHTVMSFIFLYFCEIMKKLFFLVSVFSFLNVQSQIVIDNNPPYNTATYLIDNVLLGGGIIVSNHSFIGDPNQIGFFNGLNSNLGIDSGIVLSSGNVLDLVGPNASGSTSTGFSLPGDPTLDVVIAPDPTNDAAVLEFDFTPTSDTISFKYVFGSEEYAEFVNQFNDAFGFFLSGPNPAGGMYVDENLAIVPGTVNTPVTIDNVNNGTTNTGPCVNCAYYVDNGTGSAAPQNTDITVIQFDAFTTPLTAVAAVNCGDTYHIKLVVADAVDVAYDSGIFLKAGSFSSPLLDVVDGLGIDSTSMSIPCNSTITLTAYGGIGATYQWYDSTALVISTDSFMSLGPGYYWVEAISVGCPVRSDTFTVIAEEAPSFDLGVDTNIACNSSYLLIPNVLGGTPPYTYSWSNGSTLSSQTLGEGDYNLIVSDLYDCEYTSNISITYDPPPVVDLGPDYIIPCNTSTILIPNIIGGTQPYSYEWSNGSINSTLAISTGNYTLTVSDLNDCIDTDNIEITQDIPGTVTLTGGGSICDNGTNTVDVNFNFNGLLPWNLEFTNGLSNQTIQGISDSNYLFTTNNEGIYNVVSASDVNDCLANIVGIAQVIVHPLPVAIISPAEISIYEGDAIELEVGDYAMYQWFSAEGLDLDTLSTLTVSDSGMFYVEVIDFNGCSDVSDVAIVHTQLHTHLFIPNTFTPNGDDHNELFVIRGDNVRTFNIQIFNRWGKLMFMSNSIYKSWDGTFKNKKVQEGTYYFNVNTLGYDDRDIELSGGVNVIY